MDMVVLDFLMSLYLLTRDLQPLLNECSLCLEFYILAHQLLIQVPITLDFMHFKATWTDITTRRSRNSATTLFCCIWTMDGGEYHQRLWCGCLSYSPPKLLRFQPSLWRPLYNQNFLYLFISWDKNKVGWEGSPNILVGTLALNLLFATWQKVQV